MRSHISIRVGCTGFRVVVQIKGSLLGSQTIEIPNTAYLYRVAQKDHDFDGPQVAIDGFRVLRACTDRAGGFCF